MIKKIFKYIENLWLGVDGKVSLRAVLAISFSIDFIRNFSYATTKWGEGRSLDSLATPLMIEAGLIAALLGIAAYSNISAQKIESQAANPPLPSPTITVVKAENVSAVPKPDEEKPTANTRKD